MITPSSVIINHPQLGEVVVTYKTNSRTLSARWKKGRVHLNVPLHTSMLRINEVLTQFAPKLMKRMPSLQYHDNQTINLVDLNIHIGRQTFQPDKITAQIKDSTAIIGVGSNFDFNDDATTQAISRLLCRVAKAVSPLLIPRAQKLAQALGLTPKAWSISTGHRTLGRCSSNKKIALSYMLIFLPQHLRDYIVWHELSHLTEMNHSTRFHQLCNKYCDGKEKQYIAELKSYQWPVLK